MTNAMTLEESQGELIISAPIKIVARQPLWEKMTTKKLSRNIVSIRDRADPIADLCGAQDLHRGSIYKPLSFRA